MSLSRQAQMRAHSTLSRTDPRRAVFYARSKQETICVSKAHAGEFACYTNPSGHPFVMLSAARHRPLGGSKQPPTPVKTR